MDEKVDINQISLVPEVSNDKLDNEVQMAELDTSFVPEVFNSLNNSKGHLNGLRNKWNNEFEVLYQRIIKEELFHVPTSPIFVCYDTKVTTRVDVMEMTNENDILKGRGEIETSKKLAIEVIAIDWRIKMIEDDGPRRWDKKVNMEDCFAAFLNSQNKLKHFSIDIDGCHTFWLGKLMFKYKKKELQNTHNTSLESIMIQTLKGSSVTFRFIRKVPLALVVAYVFPFLALNLDLHTICLGLLFHYREEESTILFEEKGKPQSNLEATDGFFVNPMIKLLTKLSRECTEPFSPHKDVYGDEANTRDKLLSVAANNFEGLPPAICHCSGHSMKMRPLADEERVGMLFTSLQHVCELLSNRSPEDIAIDMVQHT